MTLSEAARGAAESKGHSYFECFTMSLIECNLRSPCLGTYTLHEQELAGTTLVSPQILKKELPNTTMEKARVLQ